MCTASSRVYAERSQAGSRRAATHRGLRTLGIIGLVAFGLLVVPRAAEVQQPVKVPRIGVLSFYAPPAVPDWQQRLHQWPFWRGMRERLPLLATELVQLKLEVRDPGDYEAAFAAARRARAEALVVFTCYFNTLNRQQIVALAAQYRLPAIYTQREWVQAGGLMSYGPCDADMHRRAATYMDKVLKGVKPADLPVEQPLKFELIINLKTAQALGLTIPPTLLFQADEVIR